MDDLLQQWIDDAEEDEYFFTNLVQPNLHLIGDREYPENSGKRRCANIERDRAVYTERLERDYWGLRPMYSQDKFCLRFRMQRDLFDRILHDLSAHDSFFQQKPDALGIPGFTPNKR